MPAKRRHCIPSVLGDNTKSHRHVACLHNNESEGILCKLCNSIKGSSSGDASGCVLPDSYQDGHLWLVPRPLQLPHHLQHCCACLRLRQPQRIELFKST